MGRCGAPFLCPGKDCDEASRSLAQLPLQPGLSDRRLHGGEALMWCVIDLDGDPIATFPGDRSGWLQAVRHAEKEGGELDIVFMAYVTEGAA